MRKPLHTPRTKTPCRGVCTSTSQGDRVCRGCKRFDFEIIHWNQLTERDKKNIVDELPVRASVFERFGPDKLDGVYSIRKQYFDESRKEEK